MGQIFDLDGKKKVMFTEELKANLSYKQIMEIIIKNATEEGCHKIFCNGGVNFCPSDVFGDKIDKDKEEDLCNFESIGCTKCWSNAIEKLKGEESK